MVLSLSSPPLTWLAPVHPPLSIPIPLSTLHSALRILLRNLHPQSAYYVFTCQQTYQSKPLTLLSVGLRLFCLPDCSSCPGVSILAIRRPTSCQLTPYRYTRSIDLFETKPTRANELTPIAIGVCCVAVACICGCVVLLAASSRVDSFSLPPVDDCEPHILRTSTTRQTADTRTFATRARNPNRDPGPRSRFQLSSNYVAADELNPQAPSYAGHRLNTHSLVLQQRSIRHAWAIWTIATAYDVLSICRPSKPIHLYPVPTPYMCMLQTTHTTGQPCSNPLQSLSATTSCYCRPYTTTYMLD